jgi:hypothetical protein
MTCHLVHAGAVDPVFVSDALLQVVLGLVEAIWSGRPWPRQEVLAGYGAKPARGQRRGGRHRPYTAYLSSREA